MKDRTPFFAARLIAATSVAILIAACSSPETRAREAWGEYQTAIAAGDPHSARAALLKLVAARDDVSEYWAALGKVQLELGAFEDAAYAFTRAHELDRSNVETLATLTQLALLSGNIDEAKEMAERLELVAPSDPAINLTYGYVALRQGNLDEADRHADRLLSTYPLDSASKLLKARILFSRNERGQAIALLEDQVRARPGDAGSLRALAMLQQREGRWEGVAATARRLAQLDPRDRESALLAIEAAFRAGDVATARSASLGLLGADAPPDQVEDVLSVWAQHWNKQDAIREARRLARDSSAHQRLAYASFFNEIGSPDDAAALVGNAPQLPVTRANSSTNAIIADSLALRGQAAEAKRLFDAILKLEPDHVYALRGRIKLEMKLGQAKAAIQDAQRLVSIVPRSPRERLLLARAYAAAGDLRQVDRTLWAAFHDIPATTILYEALLAHAARTGGPEAARRVTAEFEQQRDMELAREFV